MNSANIDKKIVYIIDSFIVVIGLSLDRITKIFAVSRLKNHPSVSIIPGILELRYLENVGAAFGLLKNQKSFFILVTCVVLIVALYLIIKTPGKKKFVLINILTALIVTGAIGNTLDRFIYGYVIDFIYFLAINFPIFNVADIFITIASCILCISLLFYYKENDLNFLKFNESKIRDLSNK